MNFDSRVISRIIAVIFLSVMTVACVTETIDSSSSVKFTDTAVVSVQDPNVSIAAGSTFAWLPGAIRFYKDERLQAAPMKQVIESEIINNLKAREMLMVDSVNGARYAIAFTAALESSLDDTAIITRFGLLPGNSQVPKGDDNIEKGSLIIYVFDTRSDQVIWRSAAQVGVHFDMAMEKRKLRVQRVIAEMFQTFPVRMVAAK